MSNKERAQKIVHHMTGDPVTAQDIAQELADAGLLAPDLPEPQEHGWEIIWPVQDPDGWAVSLHNGWVRLSDERGAIFTASRKLARDLGHIFLAAANHPEEEKMSNKERAAKLLTPNNEHCQRVHRGEGGDPCMFCEYNAETAADMLADAGLLAPDLPWPDECPPDIHTPRMEPRPQIRRGARRPRVDHRRARMGPQLRPGRNPRRSPQAARCSRGGKARPTMTRPDPDAQRLRWVERQAGVYDNDADDYDEEQDTPDWTKTSS